MNVTKHLMSNPQSPVTQSPVLVQKVRFLAPYLFIFFNHGKGPFWTSSYCRMYDLENTEQIQKQVKSIVYFRTACLIHKTHHALIDSHWEHKLSYTPESIRNGSAGAARK